LMALAKGLTGGYLPLAATLTTDEIFSAFLGEYSEFKTFFHGHSYTGNQLGCAAALANLQVFEDERILEKLKPKIRCLKSGLENCLGLPHVGEVRHIGMIGAVELFRDASAKLPYPPGDKMGIKVCAEMRRRGVLTRPIGDSIVIMPPYCVTEEQIERIFGALESSVNAACGNT
jgi:adenosylmethionine---8-amino-7-oxononanoate aminotransferase